MSWGTDLWDQLDNVEAHTLKGIEFCVRYVSFVKDRCAIENEYAAKLKKLTRNYQPKKKEEEEYEFSYAKGFLDMLKEVNDIAGQHEVIAENFSTGIMKQLHTLIQQLKTDKKRILQDADRQNTCLQEQTAKFERTKKQYEKGFRESERAQEAYKKAYDDINLSRADIEKAKNLRILRERQCEECKTEYASELQKTNKARYDHYHILMPQIFQQLQDMEEKRIHQIQSSLIEGAEIERNVMPIVNACLDGIVKAANSIQSTHDIKLVVDKYKSGFEPPPDIPFEELTSSTVSENHNHSNSAKTTLKNIEKMTMSSGKGKKRGGLFGIFGGSKLDDSKDDYSHLPPNQQKKKLNQKIEALRATMAKETAERDGLQKMREVYENNPAMGDPASTSKQLEENAQKLDHLQQEMQKYERYLAEADSRNQTSREDLSTHATTFSNMAISGTQQTASSNPGTPSSARHEEAPQSDDAPMADNDSFEDLEDDFPIIGTCTALYSFDAPNEGSIAMTEREEFSIVEQDQGDGWTRVRRTTGDEGFVPTSYIDCHFYDH